MFVAKSLTITCFWCIFKLLTGTINTFKNYIRFCIYFFSIRQVVFGTTNWAWPSCSCLLCRNLAGNAKFPTEKDLFNHQQFVLTNVGRKIARTNPTNKEVVRCNFCKASVLVVQMHPHFMTKHSEAFQNLTWIICTTCHCKFPGKEFFKDHHCAVKIQKTKPSVEGYKICLPKEVCSECKCPVDVNQLHDHYR